MASPPRIPLMPRNIIPAHDARNDEAVALVQADFEAALAAAPDQRTFAMWCGVDVSTGAN